jgi:hypothetical protein
MYPKPPVSDNGGCYGQDSVICLLYKNRFNFDLDEPGGEPAAPIPPDLIPCSETNLEPKVRVWKQAPLFVNFFLNTRFFLGIVVYILISVEFFKILSGV